MAHFGLCYVALASIGPIHSAYLYMQGLAVYTVQLEALIVGKT